MLALLLRILGHVGDARAAPQQGQVKLPHGQPFHQGRVARHVRLDAHFRMRAGKTSQHVGQQGFAKILLQAQPDPPFQFRAAQGDGRLVVEFQQAARIAEQDFAGRRQRQPPSILAEQGHARLLLEFFQLRADGRGGTPHLVRRAGKAAQLDASHIAAQEGDVKIKQAHGINTIVRFYGMV
ncbi:hypothetical protein D3C87_714220 [compost metagenome]